MKIPYSNQFDLKTDRVNWANHNQHICVLPYKALQFFHSTQSVSPCCNLIKRPETDFLRPILDIKQAVESGETYKDCRDCYDCEANGKISERTRYLIELSDDQLNGFLDDTSSNLDEFYVHCTLSNLCNMACRSCNIQTSSLFAKIEMGHEYLTETILDTPNYWDTMLKSIKDAVNQQPKVVVVVSGGEGFVQSDFHRLVNWLIDEGLSKKIKLTINTNGSIADFKTFENLINNFKQIELAVSIDSIYENYHYVRWPMQWDKIKQNLDCYVEYKNKFENFNFFLTPVWSINNIFYLNDWVLFFEEYSKNVNFLASYDTPLYQPDWLDIRYLPSYIKSVLAEQLKNIVDNAWLIKNKAFHANVCNLYSICLQKENVSNQSLVWQQYLKNTAKWDVRTKSDLSIHNQKMYSIMSVDDKDLFSKFKQQFSI
jgi:organic radical activating enzyme